MAKTAGSNLVGRSAKIVDGNHKHNGQTGAIQMVYIGDTISGEKAPFAVIELSTGEVTECDVVRLNLAPLEVKTYRVRGSHRTEKEIRILLGRDPEIHSGMLPKGCFNLKITEAEFELLKVHGIAVTIDKRFAKKD